MSDHECFRCNQCGSCAACAADALDNVIDEAEQLRERLDQFEAYGMPNVAAALDRVNAAESRLAAAEECLREIANVNPCTDLCVAEECRDFPKLRRSEWCPRCIARAVLARGGK